MEKQPGESPKGYIYNPELDKYKNVILFPEKLKKVTELVKNVPPLKSNK